MNPNYSKANTAYGVPISVKLTPVIKTDLKQPVSAQNNKNTQQQSNQAQCVYFPTETRQEYAALKRTSVNHLAHKRSRSVNKTREPNSGLSIKGKGSIEKYSGFDGNGSILNEFDSTEDIKYDRPEHSRSRESINNHQTWYGPRTSVPGSRNIHQASSVKGRDLPYPRESHNSHFASEGTRPDSKGNTNVLLSFGSSTPVLDERADKAQALKTTYTTRRNSPFSSAKMIDTVQWNADTSPKEVSREIKSPLLAQTGTSWNRSRVQRCQSYRVGNKGNWTSSTEMKGGECQPWKNAKVTAETMLKNEKAVKKEPTNKNKGGCHLRQK